MHEPIEPYEESFLQRDGGHQVYWRLEGNRQGIPAVYLHGGPGAGCPAGAGRLFDPERYNLMLFDQRGSGRSSPHACLTQNTTSDLVEDIEALRLTMGADRLLLFGGSWGSTLALAYAQAYPERVSGMILRGVFTARQTELDWLYGGGAGEVFPEAWAAFLEPLRPEERDAPIAAYYLRLTDPDPAIRHAAAIAWSIYEASIVQLRPDPALAEAYTDPEFAAALARIEAHYVLNGCWLEEGQLMRNMAKIAHIPGVIVQGRYDICTPPRTAWELHQRWPASRLEIVTAGHRFDEPETLGRLIAATDEFAVRLS